MDGWRIVQGLIIPRLETSSERGAEVDCQFIEIWLSSLGLDRLLSGMVMLLQVWFLDTRFRAIIVSRVLQFLESLVI